MNIFAIFKTFLKGPSSFLLQPETQLPSSPASCPTSGDGSCSLTHWEGFKDGERVLWLSTVNLMKISITISLISIKLENNANSSGKDYSPDRFFKLLLQI